MMWFCLSRVTPLMTIDFGIKPINPEWCGCWLLYMGCWLQGWWEFSNLLIFIQIRWWVIYFLAEHRHTTVRTADTNIFGYLMFFTFFYHVDCFPLQWLQGQFDWTYMKICVQTFLVLNYASKFRYIVLIRFSSSLLEICFCQIMFEFSFDVPLTIRISFIASHCGLNACSRELGHGEICVKLCFARATGRGLRTNWQT